MSDNEMLAAWLYLSNWLFCHAVSSPRRVISKVIEAKVELEWELGLI